MRQRGFTVAYLIGGVALLSLATAAMVRSSYNSSAVDQEWSTATQMVAQANLLRQKILDCASQGGDNGSANHPAYPTGSGVAAATLTCPYGGLSLLTGTDGVFLPPAPSGFNAWTYTNNVTNVTLRLQASSSVDATRNANAMTSAAAKFGANASIVTVTTASDTFQLIVTN
jgi:hypothetical protein